MLTAFIQILSENQEQKSEHESLKIRSLVRGKNLYEVKVYLYKKMYKSVLTSLKRRTAHNVERQSGNQ